MLFNQIRSADNMRPNSVGGDVVLGGLYTREMKYLTKTSVVLAIVSLITAPLSVSAMSQPVFGPINLAGGTSASTRYYSFASGSNGFQTTELLVSPVMPIAGTVSNLYVQFDAAPGTGTTTAVTLMRNGSATTLTCSVADAASTCSDTSNTVTVAVGDTLSWRSQVTVGGSTFSPNLHVTAKFEGTNSGESFITGATNGTASITTTGYYVPYGATATTTVAHASTTMPTSGTIDKLYVNLSGSPGAGDSFIITLFKNGVSSGVTCTVSETNTSCNDLTNTVSLTAGDAIAIEISPTGSPTARAVKWGMRFRPTIDGESVHFTRLTSYSNVVRYDPVHGAGQRNQIEIDSQVVAPLDFVWRKMYYNFIYQGPSSGQSRTGTARIDSVSQSLAATVNTNWWATDLSNEVNVTTGDLINWQMTNTGSPPTSPVLSFISWVAYVAPAVSSPSSLPYRIYNLGQMLLNSGTFIIK